MLVYGLDGAIIRASFIKDGNIVENNMIPVHVADHLQTLFESKKMKENGWKSRYFWELPYGESYEFKQWLKTNFKGSRYHFYVKPYVGAPIVIYTYPTSNEVGEPFLDCEACLPKTVLIQVCHLILHEWESHFQNI